MLITLTVKTCAIRRWRGSCGIGPMEGNRGILAGKDQIRRSFRRAAVLPGGGTRRRPTAETLAAGDHFFKMKGNELLEVRAVTAEVSRDVLETAGLTAADVDLFIPHQANQRITKPSQISLTLRWIGVFEHRSAMATLISINSDCADECVKREDKGWRSRIDGLLRWWRHLGWCRSSLVT